MKMALIPSNETHKKQINAGIAGRKQGHKFESILTDAINSCDLSNLDKCDNSHLYLGNPAELLLSYISLHEKIHIENVHAWWLGGLATSGKGDLLYGDDGALVTKCKSDILIDIASDRGYMRTGISVKTCSKNTPTNDQMYFTTASAFCDLLENNGIHVTDSARKGMSMFCGDSGYRPIDLMSAEQLSERTSDKLRYYWEEIDPQGLNDWKILFETYQDDITRLLFKKAYKNDPYPPNYLLHQCVKYNTFDSCSVALFTMDEIVSLSHKYSGYTQVPYQIRKGSNKNDKATHFAPRFGFIQFQRGGQKQHPTQLQFNLKAGYFKLLPE